MILLFVGGTEAFSVEDKHLDGLSIGSKAVYRLSPDPHALIGAKNKFSIRIENRMVKAIRIFVVTTTYLGACVDGMADVEATIATEYHPIEKVALARTVHAGN